MTILAELDWWDVATVGYIALAVAGCVFIWFTEGRNGGKQK